MTKLPSGALAVLILTSSSFAQQLAPVQVLSITAGPAGSEASGGFVLHEERSVFSRTADREVIVLFRWEDVPGAHKLVAQWRSPDGGASVSSAIDYKAAEKRFGAYWRLPISPGMALGTWSIDVTMDGRPAGRFTFEVTDAKVEAAVSRRPLTEAEVYELLNASFAVLRRSGPDKRDLDSAAAFMPVPDTGRLYTVVAAIDSAGSVRAIRADRSAHELTTLVDWNRQQQWAVLAGPVSKGAALAVRADTPVKIGSRCFSMEGTADGVRVLLVGTITGHIGTVRERPALVATFGNAFGMPGAPVVDEYGQLFGIVGAGMPGDPRPVDHVVAARGDLKGAPVIPFGVVENQPSAPPLGLDQLRSSGHLMASVAGSHVASAGFVRGAKRGDPGNDFVDRFTSADKIISVVLAWSPSDRLRGQSVIRLFDADNTLLASSQPRRVNYGKGSYTQSRWEIPTPPKPGFYRVDVLIDSTTFWRGFLRVDP